MDMICEQRGTYVQYLPTCIAARQRVDESEKEREREREREKVREG